MGQFTLESKRGVVTVTNTVMTGEQAGVRLQLENQLVTDRPLALREHLLRESLHLYNLGYVLKDFKRMLQEGHHKVGAKSHVNFASSWGHVHHEQEVFDVSLCPFGQEAGSLFGAAYDVLLRRINYKFTAYAFAYNLLLYTI